MIYIALLRGINVGGKNIIKMTDLKYMFENLGYVQVKTYIQSGNVLFVSNDEEELLKQKIETAIENSFGFFVVVVLRTLEELEHINNNNPFREETIATKALSVHEVLYIAMFAQNPSSKDIAKITAIGGDDTYKITGRDIYLLYDKSIRNSKLTNSLQKTEVPCTVRNGNTIAQLVNLAQTMHIE